MSIILVVLKVTQECKETMSLVELEKWIEEHFDGCDYGKVEVLRMENADRLETQESIVQEQRGLLYTEGMNKGKPR